MENEKSKQGSRYPYYKDTRKQVIAGVCAGLADYFELDPFVVRAIFVIMGMMGLIGCAVYFILMLTLPDKKDLPASSIVPHEYKSFEEKQEAQAMDRQRRGVEYRAKREKERIQMEEWERKQREKEHQMQTAHQEEAKARLEKKKSLVDDFNSYLDKGRTSQKQD